MTYEYALKKGTVLRHSSMLGGDSSYTIENVLGQGGFGITYLASSTITVGNTEHKLYFAIKEFFVKGQCWRESSGNTVTKKSFLRRVIELLKRDNNRFTEKEQVMKYSPAAKIEVEECLKDFIEEANRLNRICGENRHIVKVNEIFQANGTAYYVMEFLNGGSLRDKILKKGSPLDEDEALSYIVPIAQAVGHIHNNHRLLHCDISPDNIILRNDENGNSTPVLIDFGESLHFNSKGVLTTKHNTIGAKDGYAPQEQYKGVASYSPQIDVYALAATLYYLVCARQPISAFDIDADYIDNNLPNYISENVRRAIKHGMERDKKLRTKTVGELLYELIGERAIDEKEIEVDESFPSELPVGFKLNLGGSIYQILEKVDNSSYYILYKAIRDNGEKNNGQTKLASIYVYEFYDPYNHKRNEDLSVSTKNDDTQSRRKYNELYYMHSSSSLFVTNGTLYFTQIKQIKVSFWKRLKSISPKTAKCKILAFSGIIFFISISFFICRNIIYEGKGDEFYTLAKKCLEQKDTVSAIPFLEKAIKYGNPTALAEMGECFFRGNGGIERDTIRAYNMFKESARKGDAIGQKWLGDFYRHGHYVEKDSLKAYELYKSSAEQGFAKGMYRLGNCYKNGIGVKIDSINAFKWYQKSAEAGDDSGMEELGECYLYGIGVKKDTVQAVKWYKKSAELGNKYAQYDLGWCYNYGHGVKKDSTESLKWYLKSAEQNEVRAMDRVASKYYYGNGVKQDKIKAFQWYLRMANLGDEGGMYHVGSCYEEGIGTLKNRSKAIEWLTKSANLGNNDAQNLLGNIYYDEKKYEDAVKWYSMSVEKENPNSMAMLGYCYFFGDGVPADSTIAVAYWEKGAWHEVCDTLENGTIIKARYTNPGAMHNLGVCYENGWGVKKNLKKSRFWYNREKGIESDSTTTEIPKKKNENTTSNRQNQSKRENNYDNVEFDDL